MKAWISEIEVLVGATKEEELIVAQDSVVESDEFSSIYKYSIHELKRGFGVLGFWGLGFRV